jgi:hypothetical protein
LAQDDFLPADEIDDDATSSRGTPDPVTEPKSAKAWYALITEAEKYFADYQIACDNADRFYANLERLRSQARERQMQLFWANMQVLGPSIYSRPPVPVVVPVFRDRRPLYRTSSELLERCTVATYNQQDIDALMRLIRDDMMRLGRGVVWPRFEDDDGQYVCLDYKYRRDFLHDPARVWAEVDWVAAASYLSKREMRKRFGKISGDEYKNAIYAVVKDDVNGKLDRQVKAKVWELWSKSGNRVVWVAEGCEKLLDEGKPHLDLENFFPCPRPAYTTCQPGTLIPVPEFLFWKDQAEEINELTGRIGALTESLRLKGFYPAGAGEIGDAIDAAMKNTQNNQILIPISNWAMVGDNANSMIVWVPIDKVVSTIEACIQLRKELISDVYQILGISDIQRGDTEPEETAAAQQLKSQYGSVRAHDKQQELVRIARDFTRIAAEIMAEEFDQNTLLEMSQMELPTDAEIKAKAKPLTQALGKLVREVEDAKTDPKVQAMAAKNPDAAKQILDQAEQQVEDLKGQLQQLEQVVTIDAVFKFLRDNKTRPFTLDIETDSTIAPDEALQQKRATEFTTAVGGFLEQSLPLVEQVPQAATMVSAMLKFVASQFRVGREVEGIIDEFADQMTEIAAQPKGPSPAQLEAQQAAEALQQKNQIETQKLQLMGQTQQAMAQVNIAKTQLAAKDLQLTEQKQQFEQQISALKLKLDTTIAQNAAQNDANITANEAIKHKSIEDTKRRAQDLDAVVSITDSLITAKSENDGLVLTHALEQDSALLDHQHELELQQNEHEHQADMQANAPTPVVAPK